MVYKEGSRGEMVKDIQEVVGAKPDGHFGPNTTKLVQRWQRENNLIPDGIVGPKSLDVMGILDTDLSSQVYTTANGLAIQKYFLPKGEYVEGPTDKLYAFLHHTSGWNNPYKVIDSWGRDNRGRIATEFVLGGQKITDNDTEYDGQMLQAMPEGAYGYHLGKTGSGYMHSHSVGLEICSFGYLENGKTYVGTKAHPNQIAALKEEFLGKSEWHAYSSKQIAATKKWIEHIADRDNINVREGLPQWIRDHGPTKAFSFNEDAYNGKVQGLLSHTNVRKDKTDVFPQEELVEMLLDI